MRTIRDPDDHAKLAAMVREMHESGGGNWSINVAVGIDGLTEMATAAIAAGDEDAVTACQAIELFSSHLMSHPDEHVHCLLCPNPFSRPPYWPGGFYTAVPGDPEFGVVVEGICRDCAAKPIDELQLECDAAFYKFLRVQGVFV